MTLVVATGATGLLFAAFYLSTTRHVMLFLLLMAIVTAASVFEARSRRLNLSAELAHLPELGDDLDAYLLQREAAFDDITEGVHKQIIWQGEPGARTEIVIVYVHGFSATLEEIRPVPDNLAKQLRANLYFTRLAGHGRPGSHMGNIKAEQWIKDLAEAIAIGQRLGDQVLVMGTSTGATLATAGFAYPGLMDKVAGLIFISPNFGLRDARARLAYLPFFTHWANLAKGGMWQVAEHGEAHGKYWTTRYPITSIEPMMQLLAAVNRLDLSKTTTPVLFYYNDTDTVVDTSGIEAIANRWAGPSQLLKAEMNTADDPAAHVIAGDIMSPNNTKAASDAIEAWVRSLNIKLH